MVERRFGFVSESFDRDFGSLTRFGGSLEEARDETAGEDCGAMGRYRDENWLQGVSDVPWAHSTTEIEGTKLGQK